MPVALGIKAITTAAAFVAAVVISSLATTTSKLVQFETVRVISNFGVTLDVGRDEITHALWMQCVTSKVCAHQPSTTPPTGNFPVTDINLADIKEFITWLNKETSKQWRLPTREEAAQFTNLLPKDNAKKLFTDPRMEWATDYFTRKSYTRAVKLSGSFGTLSNGLRDIGGNVWEWTSTCVAKDIGTFPCPAYYVNGEHEAEIPSFLRDAISGGCAAGVPPTNLGFRLVRDQSVL